MRCAIWCHLYNLKNVKNTHGGVLILVKLTFLHGYFSHFLNCANGTKSCNASKIRSESRSQSRIVIWSLVAKCIFRNCIKHNNLKVVASLDPSAGIKIWMAARELHDEDFLPKIGSYVHGSGPDFTALGLQYHKACYQT